jgi:hypothetical protein
MKYALLADIHSNLEALTAALDDIDRRGGVGQPRDGDPRASYAIYDSESGMVRFHRVAYDIKTTQQKMVKQNLPVRLISRLEKGL